MTNPPGTQAREAGPGARSIRPVIEHALTVYYDGNKEIARTLIERLIAEAQAGDGHDTD